jgi:cellulose synthase/poly-beta-1,6-N-acetylglucosamine synthase-like glycosyltransferase
MMNFFFHLFDSIQACFFRNLTWSMILHTYWFLFFVEFPRYYLIEIILVVRRNLFTYKERLKNRSFARMQLHVERPLVTVLVPGKNEGKHIYKLVTSLREQTYQNFEIIIVDDGSDDATPMICRDLEKNGFIDRYLRLESRGGKAAAANYGMYYAKGKYIVHLDADSSLDRDAIENILIPFYYDSNIKGVGGCVKVRNGDDNLCTSMQELEYLKTIQVGRLVTSTLGLYHIISGAFGAFETKTIRDIGCWDIGPGLDGDITQKLRKSGHRVYFAEDAICLTNVPTSWKRLWKQRLRWSKSLIRFRVRKHFDIICANKNFSFLNFLSNMDNIVFDCIFNYVWLIYILQLVFIYTDNLLEVMIIGWMIRLVFGVVSLIVVLMVSERAKEEKRLFYLLPIQTFYTGYFLRLARLCGHTMEIFFFSSYRDSWNPGKTSKAARLEGL